MSVKTSRKIRHKRCPTCGLKVIKAEYFSRERAEVCSDSSLANVEDCGVDDLPSK